jgi:hypothetical protein
LNRWQEDDWQENDAYSPRFDCRHLFAIHFFAISLLPTCRLSPNLLDRWGEDD